MALNNSSLQDAIELAGLLMLGVGLWWLHPAVSLIVVGGLLLGVGLWSRTRRDATRRKVER